MQPWQWSRTSGRYETLPSCGRTTDIPRIPTKGMGRSNVVVSTDDEHRAAEIAQQ